jgi:hypothetical protein
VGVRLMSDLGIVHDIQARRAAILSHQSPAVRRRILGQPTPMPDGPKPKQARLEPVRRLLPRKRDDLRGTKPERVVAAIEAVAEAFGVAIQDIAGPWKPTPIIQARQAAYLLLVERLKLSYPVAGRRLGRDHTSVLWGVRRAHEHLETNPDWTAKYRRAEAILEAQR